MPILRRCRGSSRGIQDAFVIVVPPPPVQGIGNAAGFKLQLQDRRAAGTQALAEDGRTTSWPPARRQAGSTGFFTTFRPQVPQIYLNIDRDKVEALDVPIDSVFQTLQADLGVVSTSTTSTSWAAPIR